MSSGSLFFVALGVMCQHNRVLVRILTLASYSCRLAYMVEHKLVSILGSCMLLVAKVLCGTHTGLEDSESSASAHCMLDGRCMPRCWHSICCTRTLLHHGAAPHCLDFITSQRLHFPILDPWKLGFIFNLFYFFFHSFILVSSVS